MFNDEHARQQEDAAIRVAVTDGGAACAAELEQKGA